MTDRGITRKVLALGLVGAVVYAGVQADAYRAGEAWLTSRLWNVVSNEAATSHTDRVWFGLGRRGAYGFEITPECSSLFLIMPVALLGVVGLLRRQLRLGRVLLAIVLSVSLVMLGNLVRIAAIAGLIERWGIERGYELGHLLIGSLMSIAFVALGLLTLGGIIFRRSSQRPSLAVAP